MSNIAALRLAKARVRLIKNDQQLVSFLKSYQGKDYILNDPTIHSAVASLVDKRYPHGSYILTPTYPNSSIIASATSIGKTYDVTPNSFSFTNIASADVSSYYTTPVTTLAGIMTGVNFAVEVPSTCTVSINGGAFTAPPVSIQNGQTFQIKAQASASYLTTINIPIKIGNYTTTWSITTRDPFSALTRCYCTFNNTLTDQTGLSSVSNSISTTIAGPYGGSTLAMATNGALIVSSGYLAFGTGDFTIEFWYRTKNPNTTSGIFSSLPGSGSANGIGIITNNPTALLYNAYLSNNVTGIVANTWYRIVVERYGSTVTCWKDGGVAVQRTGITLFNVNQSTIYFGNRYNTGGYPCNATYQMYFADLRITSGARYQGAGSIGVPGNYTGY